MISLSKTYSDIKRFDDMYGQYLSEQANEDKVKQLKHFDQDY